MFEADVRDVDIYSWLGKISQFSIMNNKTKRSEQITDKNSPNLLFLNVFWCDT